jgi:hypothetical protein
MHIDVKQAKTVETSEKCFSIETCYGWRGVSPKFPKIFDGLDVSQFRISRY